MNKKGYALASANYRMYKSEGHPEFNAKYPDFIEDAAAAVAFVKNNAEKYGIGDKLIVGGSSAGGYLSMMLCFDEHYLAAHGLSPASIAGFVHDAGQPTTHFNVLRERGLDSRRLIVDEAAPLYHVGKASTYPPMLVIVSDHDLENRLEQTTLLLSTLRHFRYNDQTIELLVAHGTHNAYCSTRDADGNNILATMIEPFLSKYAK
jgi:acetyl esterase/lipase